MQLGLENISALIPRAEESLLGIGSLDLIEVGASFFALDRPSGQQKLLTKYF